MESCLRNKKEDNTSLSVESSIQCSHRFSSENIRSATKSLKLASTRRKKEHTFFFFSFDDIISGHKGNYDCIKSVEVISLIQSKKKSCYLHRRGVKGSCFLKGCLRTPWAQFIHLRYITICNKIQQDYFSKHDIGMYTYIFPILVLNTSVQNN